ncbi:MAG: hypothetical protein KDC43_03720 [Saprospiraceae bacterium]|nr:hypothetical protein [Saprospiraceae bacterium]MCP5299049.1 threonine transporter [Chromatiaceae bacterium]
MTDRTRAILPFNTPFETGLRSLGILSASYPVAFDLQRLVAFDHLVVHTGDIGGPDSLHPDVPLRSAELLVRRGLVERGLLVMTGRGLIERVTDPSGFLYRAGEFSATFIGSLASPYLSALRDRASWVVERYGGLDDQEFRETMSRYFDQWIEQFHIVQQGASDSP